MAKGDKDKGSKTKTPSTGGGYDPFSGVSYPDVRSMPKAQADQINAYNMNDSTYGDTAKLRAGVNDGGAADAFARHTLGIQSTPTSGGGGGGSGGKGGNSNAARLAALKGMYEMYKGIGVDQGNLDLLNRFADQASTTGNGAIDSARAQLQAQLAANPYQSLNLGPVVQASNPMANYLQAQGMGGDPAVTSMMQMLQGQNDVAQANAQQLQGNLAAIDQNARAGNLNDLTFSGAAFAQQLANQKLLNQNRFVAEAKAKQDAMQQAIFEQAMKYGLNPAKLGMQFGAPSTPAAPAAGVATTANSVSGMAGGPPPMSSMPPAGPPQSMTPVAPSGATLPGGVPFASGPQADVMRRRRLASKVTGWTPGNLEKMPWVS